MNIQERLSSRFVEIHGSEPEIFITTPGRIEICGNHTDHQHGNVVAAAVNIEILGVASRNSSNIVNLYSESFGSIICDLRELDARSNERNTSAGLIRGIAYMFRKNKKKIGGINAVITSNVPVGSGLSSSAAFEVLIANMFNCLYNSSSIPPLEIADYCVYSENNYFGKPSGKMDQITCAYGGLVGIDFSDPEHSKVTPLQLDLRKYGYSVCIVHTYSDHADLTSEYAAITGEMKEVASYFEKEFLNDLDEEAFYDSIPALAEKFGDRAVLRSIHFFEETKRAADLLDATRNEDIHKILQLINESGNSSYKFLQNVYSPSSPHLQKVSLCIALTEKILRNSEYACRIHGGGFGGTILVLIPEDMLSYYSNEMKRLTGKDCVIPVEIRESGPIITEIS